MCGLGCFLNEIAELILNWKLQLYLVYSIIQWIEIQLCEGG